MLKKLAIPIILLFPIFCYFSSWIFELFEINTFGPIAGNPLGVLSIIGIFSWFYCHLFIGLFAVLLIIEFLRKKYFNKYLFFAMLSFIVFWFIVNLAMNNNIYYTA